MPIRGRLPPFAEFIDADAAPEIFPSLRRVENARRPLDSDPFAETVKGETERSSK